MRCDSVLANSNVRNIAQLAAHLGRWQVHEWQQNRCICAEPARIILICLSAVFAMCQNVAWQCADARRVCDTDSVTVCHTMIARCSTVVCPGHVWKSPTPNTLAIKCKKHTHTLIGIVHDCAVVFRRNRVSITKPARTHWLSCRFFLINLPITHVFSHVVCGGLGMSMAWPQTQITPINPLIKWTMLWLGGVEACTGYECTTISTLVTAIWTQSVTGIRLVY